MIFCIVKDPVPTRIALLVAFAFAYALFHAVRWYLRRPKVEKEEPVAPRASVAAPKEAVAKAAVAPKAEARPQAPAQAGNAVVSREEPGAEPARQEPAINLEPYSDEEVQRIVRLGKAAFGAGWIVEAHFWLTIARANGVHGLGARLLMLQRDWQDLGCPEEPYHGNADYSSDHAAIAQAYMLFKCGIDQRANADFILSRMEAGSRTARTLAFYERLAEPAPPPADA